MVDPGRPRVLLVATRSADRHVGGSAMRAATARRGLEQVGDVTYVLVDEQAPDRPDARLDPTVAVLHRRRRGLPYRWPTTRAALGGRGRLPDALAAGRWQLPDGLDPQDFDLAWFVKAGPLLAWPGPLPAAVVLDVDDLEEDTRAGAGLGGVLHARMVAGLRSRLARQATTLVACTPADLVRLPPGPARAVVPNAAPRATGPVVAPSVAPHLLFVGVLGYPPNRDGLAWFVRQVLPIVRQHVPEVDLRIVGPGAEALPADIRRQVTTTGAVADLAAEYAWSRAVVVPVLTGSGTRVKILDALAHARAVVSTTPGARGLGLCPGTDLLVADGARAFADACLDVLAPGRAEKLAAAGAAVVGGRLSAAAVEDSVADVARAALGSRGRVWVDVSSVRGWTGTPHGIARVEAGMARGVAAVAPSAGAVWLGRHGLRAGARADLRDVSDGRESARPGFDPDELLEPPTALGRVRVRVTAASTRLPPPSARLVEAGLAGVVEARAGHRHRRAARQWRGFADPADTVLVPGHDWNSGTVAAVTNLPPGRRPRLWVVVHDLFPLLQPHVVPDRAARERFTAWIRLVAASADGIVAVSHATAAAIEEAVAGGLLPRPRRVVVVRSAVEVAATGRAPAQVDRLVEPYVVYVATVEARKNHAVLVDAVRQAAARGEVPPTVVWLGSWGWGTESLRTDLARDPLLRRHIAHLDGLPDDEMRWVVEHAAAIVFPSRFEGYGLPVAEARLLGTPVIASDLPALREASDGIGLFLDPDDVDAWRQVLVDVASRPPDRTPPSSSRTWAEVAAEVLAAIEAS